MAIVVGVSASGAARAHCDSLDGPVVRDAQTALDRRDAREAERHAAESVAAGRAYVASYVEYAHFVERIDDLVRHGAPDTHHEPLSPSGHE